MPAKNTIFLTKCWACFRTYAIMGFKPKSHRMIRHLIWIFLDFNIFWTYTSSLDIDKTKKSHFLSDRQLLHNFLKFFFFKYSPWLGLSFHVIKICPPIISFFLILKIDFPRHFPRIFPYFPRHFPRICQKIEFSYKIRKKVTSKTRVSTNEPPAPDPFI